MAKTVKTEEYSNATEETVDQAEMYKQLLAMQEQIRAQMAELEAAQKAQKPGKQKPAVSDAWDRMRTVYLPRPMGREQKFLLVGVNGKRYQVPRGKPVEVPEPLAERIDIMLEAEERAIRARTKWDNDAAEAENVLKRVL